MSSSGPYSISLLNDLHHHFPDLLYFPQRFQSVQQVLNYIIRVAQETPYERESIRYYSSHGSHGSHGLRASHPSASTPRRINPFSHVPSFSSASPRRSYPFSSHVSSAPSTSAASAASGRDTVSIERTVIPLSSLLSAASGGSDSSDGSNAMPLSYLTAMLQMLAAGDNGASTSASDNHPTADEIRENTVVHMALESSQDECCSICHEGFEDGQQLRQLRHCAHMFHLTCIDTWLTSHATCPNCRRDIRQA